MELNVGHKKVPRPRSPEAMKQAEARELKERMLRLMDSSSDVVWKDAFGSLAAGAYQVEKLWDGTKMRQEDRPPPPAKKLGGKKVKP